MGRELSQSLGGAEIPLRQPDNNESSDGFERTRETETKEEKEKDLREERSA